MTTETRDLDRACAEAMGWTVAAPDYDLGMGVSGDTVQWKCKPKHCGDTWALRAYSTDPSTQAEKLAWLRACDFRFVEITGWDDGTWVAKGFGSPDHHLDREEQGATIDEALAALVVAVAKAKKEQGK